MNIQNHNHQTMHGNNPLTTQSLTRHASSRQHGAAALRLVVVWKYSSIYNKKENPKPPKPLSPKTMMYENFNSLPPLFKNGHL
jgi:hypothetical protein